MMIISKDELRGFFNDQPCMSIVPVSGNNLILKGEFQFIATSKNKPEIRDSFNLKVEIPLGFPKKIPKVWEIGKKIPKTKDGEYHINPDGSLCLGSPLRLLDKINRSGTLAGFVESCLVPFLYAVSLKLQNGGNFYMGELAHGFSGVLDDYRDLFGIENNENIIRVLELIGMKKRIANKALSPCLCEQRLGRCRLRFVINRLRKTAFRSFFQNHANNIKSRHYHQ